MNDYSWARQLGLDPADLALLLKAGPTPDDDDEPDLSTMPDDELAALASGLLEDAAAVVAEQKKRRGAAAPTTEKGFAEFFTAPLHRPSYDLFSGFAEKVAARRAAGYPDIRW